MNLEAALSALVPLTVPADELRSRPVKLLESATIAQF